MKKTSASVTACPYQRVFGRGVKLIGATAHYVAENPDEGATIASDVIRCNHRDTIENLIRKGWDIERWVSEVVGLHAEHRKYAIEA